MLCMYTYRKGGGGGGGGGEEENQFCGEKEATGKGTEDKRKRGGCLALRRYPPAATNKKNKCKSVQRDLGARLWDTLRSGPFG